MCLFHLFLFGIILLVLGILNDSTSAVKEAIKPLISIFFYLDELFVSDEYIKKDQYQIFLEELYKDALGHMIYEVTYLNFTMSSIN